MKNYISAILLAIFAIPSFGQSISIFDIDTTNFPTMKAKFYALDQDGNPTYPNLSDVKLTENNVNRKVLKITCPPKKLQTVSIGVMVDTYSRIDLARKGVQKLVDYLQMPNDELGITYMAKGVYIYQDFTKSKTKALDKAVTIPSAPGVDINSMFNSPVTGGMPFINDKKNDKKVLILISDLHCPNLTIDEKKLIEEAKANGISIYSVLLGTNDYSRLFTRIANGSGGKVFENVTSVEQIEKIFEEIRNIVHYEPCEIEWEGGFACNEYAINVEFLVYSQTTNNSYLQPFQSRADLTFINPVLAFGRVAIGTKSVKSLKIFSSKTDFTIQNINKIKGSKQFKIKSSLPIQVKKDDTCNIEVEYEQIDSSVQYVMFDIETQFCNLIVTANGGYFEKNNNQQTLKVTYPNGGEKFAVGETEKITWEGVSKQDTVILEYSIDSGKTWQLLSDKATNLSYEWKNIPRPTSNSCLVKVSQLYDNTKINNLEVLTLKGHQLEVRDFAITNDDFTLYSCDRGGNINIWDINSGIKTGLLKHNNLNGGYSGSRIAINNTNTQLVITSGSNLFSFNLIDNSFMYQRGTSMGGDKDLGALDFNNDGRFIVANAQFLVTKMYSKDGYRDMYNGYGHGNYPTSLCIFNNDKLIVSSGWDGYLKLWNYEDLKLIKEFLPLSGQLTDLALSKNEEFIVTSSSAGSYGIIKTNTLNVEQINNKLNEYTWTIAISPDNKKIVTGGESAIVKIWDFETGKLIKELKGHKGAIKRIKFTNNGNKIISGSSDFDLKIWDVDFGIAQTDISDSLFSIVAPEPRFNFLNIDMGEVVVGDSKDTMVTAVLCNTGEAPLHILGVDVTNGDKEDFMVPRGAGEFYLAPNECRDFMFEFMPMKLGPLAAKITVKSTIGDFIDTINIKGVGIAPQLEIVNKLIDFGDVYLGNSQDSIQAVTIKNSGKVAVSITNIKLDTLNDIDFSILDTLVTFELKPNETIKLNLRFSPRYIGRTSGIILFEYNGIGSPAKVELVGRGIGGNFLLQVGSAEDFVNKKIDIPIKLITNNIAKGIKYISLELQFNKTMFYPTVQKNVSVKNGMKYIRLDSIPINNNELNQEIANVKFTTALGNSKETQLSISDYVLFGGDAEVNVEQGKFKLLGVNKDDGDSSQNGTDNKSMILSFSPNPANEYIDIGYANADEGLAEIRIYNLLGQLALVKKLEKTQKGLIKLDLSEFTTGQYYLTFITETIQENIKLIIIK